MAQVNPGLSSGTGAANYSSAQINLDWRVTGPTGGDVRALVVDPQDPQRFYFGTLDGQIYTSTDGGQSWRLFANLERTKLFVDHIIVDPRDSKRIYAGGHRHTDPGGFFRTVDGGVTWREAPELKQEAIHSMTQSSMNPDLLIVGTNNGLYRSTNSGQSWSKIETANGPKNVESLAIDPHDTNTIYAGTWWLPYKTTDGGQTWRVIKQGMIDDSDIFAIDIDPRDSNHIIASACSGIYDSHNGGELWHKVQGIPSQSRRTRAILQHPSTPGLVFAGTTQGFWRSTKGGQDGSWMRTTSGTLEINAISVHPQNPDVIYISTNNYGVMFSRDAGKTFVPTNNGFSSRLVSAILPDRENPARIYVATSNTATGGGFFFVSNDAGETWEPSMRNMPAQLIASSILQDERDANIIYLGTNLGVYRSTDRGLSWSSIGEPKAAPAPAKGRRGRAPARRTSSATAAMASGSQASTVRRAQEALNQAGFYIGKPDGQAGTRTVAAIRGFQAAKGLPVSGKLDNATLTALGLGAVTPNALPSDNLPTVFITDAINQLTHTWREGETRPGMLAATNTGLYRTFDPAQGWERISYGAGFDTRTTAVAATMQNKDEIWVGTATSGVLVSRDGGKSWTQMQGIPTVAPISSIELDPTRSAYAYVGTKQSFYFTHNGGEHWTRRGGNLPYGDYASILINPRNPDEIITGNAYQEGEGAYYFNSGGVYRSTDAGMTWRRIDPRDVKLPSQRIWALAFDQNNPNRIFIGSHSSGVYVADRAGTSASRER